MPVISHMPRTRLNAASAPFLALLLALLVFASDARDDDGGGLVDWQSWSPAVFEQAAEEDKLVLLDLKAVWCHWCHVRDREPYANAEVADYLAKH